MLETFKFTWNDKVWSAYFNALMREKIIVHFEDIELRDLFGAPLEYTKSDSHDTIQLNIDFPLPYQSVLSIIRNSIESRLGMTMQDFLLIEDTV